MPKPPPGSMPGMVPPDVASMMEQGFAQQAQQQKTSIQNPMQPAGSSSGLGGAAAGAGLSSGTGQPQQQGFQHQQTPRELGTVPEEAKLMVTDVVESVRDILGIKRDPKTPEEKAQMQQFHQGWQRLTAAQRQVAQQRVQAEEQRKEMQQQEDEAKKQQKSEMDQHNQLVVPAGKVSGQAALDKMQQDRKGMGGASG